MTFQSTNETPKNAQSIAVIGGGPGGLYFSILTKKALPNCQIDVY
jgi:anthraniloyl-CoA monooxygenase